jgi:hypothetical protein
MPPRKFSQSESAKQQAREAVFTPVAALPASSATGRGYRVTAGAFAGKYFMCFGQTGGAPDYGEVFIADLVTVGPPNVEPTIPVSLGSPTAVSKIWCGTQVQYDAITTKDAATLYFVK